MIVELIRVHEPEATTGILVVNSEILGFTMERGWYGNQRNISCIPTGEYICKKHESPTFGRVYKVCDVFGRSNILFHAGNKVDDTQGCILLGDRLGYENDIRWIYNSKNTLNRLFSELNNVDEFKLIIK
jgi:hypothetical protein